MIMPNGYITQLLNKYKPILKQQGFKNTKTVKEYQLLVTEIPQKTKGFNPTIIKLQLRRLEQLAENNTELSNNDNWAELTTTLTPTSYVHKLLENEIAEYQKKGIKIQQSYINMPNGYITQLLQIYNFVLKQQEFQHQKEIKEYQLLVTEIPQKTKGFNPTIIKLQLRRLEQLAENNTELSNNDNWAELTTTLTPTSNITASYIYKLLEQEIEEYIKKGIKIQKDIYVLIKNN